MDTLIITLTIYHSIFISFPIEEEVEECQLLWLGVELGLWCRKWKFRKFNPIHQSLNSLCGVRRISTDYNPSHFNSNMHHAFSLKMITGNSQIMWNIYICDGCVKYPKLYCSVVGVQNVLCCLKVRTANSNYSCYYFNFSRI